MKHIEPKHVEKMRQQASESSDAFIRMALEIAEKIGDKLAYEIYTAEISKRMLKSIGPLDPIPEWNNVGVYQIKGE